MPTRGEVLKWARGELVGWGGGFRLSLALMGRGLQNDDPGSQIVRLEWTDGVWREKIRHQGQGSSRTPLSRQASGSKRRKMGRQKEKGWCYHIHL